MPTEFLRHDVIYLTFFLYPSRGLFETIIYQIKLMVINHIIHAMAQKELSQFHYCSS